MIASYNNIAMMDSDSEEVFKIIHFFPLKIINILPVFTCCPPNLALGIMRPFKEKCLPISGIIHESTKNSPSRRQSWNCRNGTRPELQMSGKYCEKRCSQALVTEASNRPPASDVSTVIANDEKKSASDE